MTRKRFIKLVMSFEIQRNEAERIAQGVALYGNYEKMYTNIINYLYTKKTLNIAKRGFRWLLENLRGAATAMSATLIPTLQSMVIAAREKEKNDSQNQQKGL